MIDTSSRRADSSWSDLRERIRAVHPRSVARGLIGAGVVGLVIWLAAASWPALAPYVLGGLIGYAVLPLVNRLSALMPRTLAAIIALLTALGLVALFLWLVVPPLISGLGRLAALIPEPGAAQGPIEEIEAWIATLPAQVAPAVEEIFQGVVQGLRDALAGTSGSVTNFIVNQTLGILGTINFVFGLFVLPVWMTSFLASPEKTERAFTVLPAGVRADAQAVARIMDRSAATYLRARALLAVLTGLFIYLGLEMLNRLGVTIAPNGQVAVATLLGVLQLIPEIGILVGFLPVVLLTIVSGLGPGVVLGGLYVGSEMLASRIAERRVQGGVRDLSPLLLIPAIVALSQFGVLWLFLAAPIVGIVVDLAKYGFARFGDPPTPAGVIPGETATGGEARPARIPSVYRTAAEREGLTSG